MTVVVLAGLGLVSSILPWREADIFGRTLRFKGIDDWQSYVAIALFVAAAALTMIGKKEAIIKKGIQKFGILIMSGLLVLFFLFLEGAWAMHDLYSPSYGLHLGLFASLGLMLAPFLFKADGSVSIPSVKEIVADVEDNAEVFEDQVEDIADKIEDKVEDTFDKDDEQEDKAEKKEENKTEE